MNRERNNDCLIIGIAGGTGSGKSTLVKKLKAHFQDQICVISHDWYYRVQDGLTYEMRAKSNYDCPDAIETDLLVSHLKKLCGGEAVYCPQYDFTVHNRSKDVLEVLPKKVILVEGILIFADPALCDMFDVKIFVDTDADVRILRRLIRDVNERGRSIESVEAQYLATVKPMHEMYVEPSKKKAQIIVPEGGENLVALEFIIGKIAEHLGKG